MIVIATGRHFNHTLTMFPSKASKGPTNAMNNLRRCGHGLNVSHMWIYNYKNEKRL